MLFKFKGFYRQFSFFSLRLLNKKITSSTTTTASLLPTTLTNSSPTKNRRGFSIKNGWKSNNSELRSVLQHELRAAYSRLQRKEFERTSETFKNYQSQSSSSSSLASIKEIQPTGTKTLDLKQAENSLIFPLLTGEELKTFDSSVFE